MNCSKDPDFPLLPLSWVITHMKRKEMKISLEQCSI